MKLPAELQSAIDTREQSRAAYTASKGPSPLVTSISELLDAKRAELIGATDSHVIAGLHGEIAGLELALENHARPPSPVDIDTCRREVIASNVRVGQAATKFHRERCAPQWAAFGSAVAAAFDALDAVSAARTELQSEVGTAIDDGGTAVCRQLLNAVADAARLPLRP